MIFDVITWFDQHAAIVAAFGLLVNGVASFGAWICTIWSDRRVNRKLDRMEKTQ